MTFLLTWYIGSKLTSSLIQKKIMEAWTATGLYPSRVSSISFSVSLATFCFLAISSLRTLDELRIWIAVSSSEKSHSILSQIKVEIFYVKLPKMLPWELDKTFRILSSISFSCNLLLAVSITNLFFISSSSGFSSAANMPRSWSSKPSCVMTKFRTVT